MSLGNKLRGRKKERTSNIYIFRWLRFGDLAFRVRAYLQRPLSVLVADCECLVVEQRWSFREEQGVQVARERRAL